MKDFTVIQKIYSDGVEFMTKDNVEPVMIQEYDFNIDDVRKIREKGVDAWFKTLTDETYNVGQIISAPNEWAIFLESVVEEQAYEDFKAYIAHHPEFREPSRQMEVRINNVDCYPSAKEKRQREGEALGRWIGKKLNIGGPNK